MSSSDSTAAGGVVEGGVVEGGAVLEEEEEEVNEGVPLSESEVSIASEPVQPVSSAGGQSAESGAEDLGVEGESAATQTPR